MTEASLPIEKRPTAGKNIKKAGLIAAPGDYDVDLAHSIVNQALNESIRLMIVFICMHRRFNIRVPWIYRFYEIGASLYYVVTVIKYAIILTISLLPALQTHYLLICHLPGRIIVPGEKMDESDFKVIALIQFVSSLLHLMTRTYNFYCKRSDFVKRELALCFLPESYFEPDKKPIIKKYKIGSRMAYECDLCNDTNSNRQHEIKRTSSRHPNATKQNRIINTEQDSSCPHFIQCDSIYSWHLYKSNCHIYKELLKDDENWNSNKQIEETTHSKRKPSSSLNENNEQDVHNLRSDQFITLKEQKRKLLAEKRRISIRAYLSRATRFIILIGLFCAIAFLLLITPQEAFDYEKRYPKDCEKPDIIYLHLRGVIDFFETVVFISDSCLAVWFALLFFMTLVYDIVIQARHINIKLVHLIRSYDLKLASIERITTGNQRPSFSLAEACEKQQRIFSLCNTDNHRHNLTLNDIHNPHINSDINNVFDDDLKLPSKTIYELQDELLDFFAYIEHVDHLASYIIFLVVFLGSIEYASIVIAVGLFRVHENEAGLLIIVIFFMAATFIFMSIFSITDIVKSLVMTLYPKINSFVARDNNVATKRRWSLVYEHYYPKFRCTFTCLGQFTMAWSSFVSVSITMNIGKKQKQVQSSKNKHTSSRLSL